MSENSPQDDTYSSDAAELARRRFLNLGAIAVSWVVMLACVHVMYVAFVQYGSKPRLASVLATLTQNGKDWYFPERELPIYVVGCTLAFILTLVAAFRWRSIAVKQSNEDPSYVKRICYFSLILAAFGSGANITWLMIVRQVSLNSHLSKSAMTLALLLPAIFEMALLYESLRANPNGIVRRFLVQLADELSPIEVKIAARRHDSKALPTQHKDSTKAVSRWIDYIVVALIFLLVFIPRTDLLAGTDFHYQSFHHWDFFAMGPAIGLVKGKALATQVYSQYGIGWPLLLAKLDPLIRLSYGHTYKIAITFGCIYFCGLYWLLRRLFANPAWAIAGILLALRLQVFHGDSTDPQMWCVPSASTLRTPCDVWVMLLLLSHWRSQKPILLMTAGALVGLSVLFIIDTGVYLTITFVAYNFLWLLSAFMMRDATRPARLRLYLVRIGSFLTSMFIASAVLICGLYAASGSSVFAPGYVHKWLEVLSLFPSGISMLPMVQYPEGVFWSYCFVVLFLASLCAGMVRAFLGCTKPNDPIIICISLLGLFYLIYYIGRSHPYLIFQLSTPFCLVIVWALNRLAFGLWRLFGSSTQLSVPTACGAVALAGLLVLLLNGQFRTYPNLLTAIFLPAPRNVQCYVPDLQDVCVTPEQFPNIGPYLQTVTEMKQMTKQGKSFAIIADDDTSLYVASRATLWNRYTPLLPSLATKSMLNEVDRELSKRTVDYVFVLRKDPFTYASHPTKWRLARTTESWEELAATVRRCYRFDHECGTYDVWRR